MSVVSSRVSSVSSILKAPGVRSQLIRQSNRVYFKLPKDIRSIIYNFEAGNSTKDYEELICVLRDSNIKDSDLVEFLAEARQCVSLLGPTHKLFIEALLQIKWTSRSPEITSAYKMFLDDLISMHIQHTKHIIDNLVEQFKPVESDHKEWEAGTCKEKDMCRLKHIHDVLCKILKVVPMSTKLLLQSIRARFPYIVHGTHAHEVYVCALLQILEYAPQLRSDILSLIINRLVVLDVNIPRPDPSEDDGDEDMMDAEGECDGILGIDNSDAPNDEKEKALHPIAHTLDVCMEQILQYIKDTCFQKGDLNIESLRSLYLELLRTFETLILTTHASQYVQFIMFYICSFKSAVVEAFVDWLWRKASDPNIPSVMRQSSAAYIASLLSVASFVPLGLVKVMLTKLSRWIHNYIARQDDSECVEDTKEHIVFYSICQALFVIINNKYKIFINSKDSILYLQELDLHTIVTCKLNPLKACLPDVVHTFADLTRTYQLAYCYTIIENNTRSQLSVLHARNYITVSYNNFFPFDTYTLPRSGERIVPFLNSTTLNTNNGLAARHKQ